LIYKMIL